MAEAHQAVAFSFSVTHEGLVINYDVELLNVVWLSGVRSWKKRMQRFAVCSQRTLFSYGKYRISSLLIFIIVYRTTSRMVYTHRLWNSWLVY